MKPSEPMIDPTLRRAFMLVQPDYFSWPPESQERYRVRMPEKDRFRLEQALLKALFRIHVRTEEQLKKAVQNLSEAQLLALNRARLPITGVGEDYFFLNEFMDGYRTILDFETLHDYDYDDHCFQEQARKEEIPDYAIKPYRGTLYHTWARLFIDGEFHYASLSMAAGYIFSILDECGHDKIAELIPHRYVRGKDHGRREGKGTIFSQRREAGGLELQLEELDRRSNEYLASRFEVLLNEFDSAARKAVYLLDRSRENDPQADFVFTDKTALQSVRFRHFMSGCRTLLADPAELEVFTGRERRALTDFLESAFRDIIANFDPKVVKFRKKHKIVIADGALDGLV